MSLFPRTSVQVNATEMPAIVQNATRDWSFYQQAIISSEERTGALLKEYKEGGTWRERYKTWTDACVPLNISRSQANRLIAEESGASCATEPTWEDKQNTLSKIVSLPEPGQERPIELHRWASRALALFKVYPKSKLHNRLSLDGIRTFESSLNSLYSVLGELLPQKPEKILCKCGCGLSARVSEELFKVGVPCKGLTVGQAGLIMKKLADNEWRLPSRFAFLKNEGEWVERQWRK